MTPRIDAGGIAATGATLIEPDETAGELEERLARLGAPLVACVIDAIALGPIVVQLQERSKVTRAPKLRKEDGLIDWSRPARAVHNHVRAMQPWPAASTFWRPRLSESKPPMRLIVHRTEITTGEGTPGEVIVASGDRLVVAAGDGAVALRSIQLPGKKASAPCDFMRGHRIVPGDVMATIEHS